MEEGVVKNLVHCTELEITSGRNVCMEFGHYKMQTRSHSHMSHSHMYSKRY